jgi:hypothetical protein
MENVDPTSRLTEGNNVWNVCVLDNIDFMESTFRYGNIFDVTRGTSHATLRMVFQFTFPRPLQELLQQAQVKDHSDEQLFGTTKYTDDWLVQCQTAIRKALQSFGYGFDIDAFEQELAQTIPWAATYLRLKLSFSGLVRLLIRISLFMMHAQSSVQKWNQ